MKKHRWLRHIISLVKKISEDNIPLYAANASFFIIIAVFPAVSLLLYVIQLTPATREDLIAVLSPLFPQVLSPLFDYLINDLFGEAGGTIISVSAVMAAWSASRGVYSMLDGLNAVYDLDETRNFVLRRLIALVYMLGLLLAIILTLVLHVFGEKINELIIMRIPAAASISSLLLSLRYLILAVLLSLIFNSIYNVFPNRRAKFLSQLPGAVMAAVGWLAFSSLFSLYVNYFSDFSRVYGNLATIVLAMLWLYFCMTILYAGGSINAWLEKSGLRRSRRNN